MTMSSLTLTQQHALLNLYSKEITQRLEHIYDSPEKGVPFADLLPLGDIEKLSVECSSSAEFSERLWICLQASALNNVLYVRVLAYLMIVDNNLHDLLSMVSERERRSRFSCVLQHLEHFLKFIDTTKSLEHLKRFEHYAKSIEKIESTCTDLDDSVRKKVILRSVPFLGYDALSDILRSFYDSSDEANAFIESISPNFLRNYKLLTAERATPRGHVTVWGVNDSNANILDPHRESKSGPIDIDLNWEGFPSTKSAVEGRLLETLSMVKESPLVLRSYQHELCASSLQGKNSIISAPTGSGKTVVAANIIKFHLNARTREGKYAKVLFLIDKTMILDQQSDVLRKYLGHRFEVASTRGADNTPLRELINAKDVIVCTPALIVNLLKETSDEMGGKTPFTLCEFSMIVFDECHNTRKNSPYSVIMQSYHRIKMTGRFRNGYGLPQIVGLTASLGVGKNTKTADDALKYMVSMCALMDCKIISLVRHHIEELNRHAPVTADELRSCVDIIDKDRLDFSTHLCAVMIKFEERMYRLLEDGGVPVSSRDGRSSPDLSDSSSSRFLQYDEITRAPSDKSSSDYRNWVSCHLGRIIPEANLPTDGLKRHVTEVLEMLRDLHLALELHEDFTSSDALSFIDAEIKLKTISDVTRNIWDNARPKLHGSKSSKNSMVDEVVGQLLKQQSSCPNFRSIIFIRTRRGADILTSLLNEHEHIVSRNSLDRIKSEPVCGLNKIGDDGKRTNKREQTEKLDRFASGETRVLVATSVAEEGLDVAQCNLVIKYNYATNEIAHVQRRGRGRAEDSRCILVTNSVRLREQEEKNVMKEKLMKQALREIELRRFDLENAVKLAVADLWNDITLADALEAEHIVKQRTKQLQYTLKCSKCEVFLCKHVDIKTHQDSQYCVCDPDFWSKVKCLSLSEEEQKESRYCAVGKLACASAGCGNFLGRIVRLESTDMPVLAATSFVLTWTEGGQAKRKAMKKWLQIKKDYFTPSGVRSLDLMAMRRANSGPTIQSDASLIGLL